VTYYKDLTRYEYFAEHEPLEPKPLNVSWLSGVYPFDTGETPQEFKEQAHAGDAPLMLDVGLH